MIHFLEKKQVANTKKYDSFFSELFLFKELSENKIQAILNTIDIEICEFEPNEFIYAPNDFKTKVGFVISGELTGSSDKIT